MISSLFSDFRINASYVLSIIILAQVIILFASDLGVGLVVAFSGRSVSDLDVLKRDFHKPKRNKSIF